TEETAPQIADICRVLGGLPLAIELLVPRVKVFPTPEQLLRQLLKQRRKHKLLDMLTCARSDMPERHRALATTFNLTYALLSQEEQRFFRQLSIFHGSFTQEAAEIVCSSSYAAGSSTLDMIQSLYETGLLYCHDSRSPEPRHALLPPLREFGSILLESAGEVEDTHKRYQKYYLHLAEQSEPGHRGRKQLAWEDLLEDEHDNLRAILSWCWKTGNTAQGLQLACNLLWFWFTRGYWREGRDWLNTFLSQTDSPVPSAILAKANFAAAYLAFFQGDVGLHTQTQLKQSIELYQEVGDNAGRAYAQTMYAMVDFDPTTSRALIEESITIFRSLGNSWAIGWALIFLGYIINKQDGWEQARIIFEEGQALSRKIGDKHGIAWSSLNLGDVAYFEGNYQAAAKHYRTSLAGFREMKNELGIAWAQCSLANTQLRLSNYKAASKEYEESLYTSHERLQDKIGTYGCLVGIAELFIKEQCWKQAAITLGAARQVFETFDKRQLLRPTANLEALEAVLCKRLKEEVFTRLVSRGYDTSTEAAIQYVLDELHQLVFPREEEKKNMPEHIHVVRAHA
ncbi:MAG TPA: tetratricopeptide repeat protein, partial [Ktedonobacteraceae bacterium]